MKLPIYPAKGKLINQIQRLDTAIVIGETGSGKTTQIPQVYSNGAKWEWENHTNTTGI